MPLSNPYGIGGVATSRGKTSLVSRIGALPSAVAVSRFLLVENLPLLQLRATQLTNQGVGLGASLELQGMVRTASATATKWETYQTFAMPAGGTALIPFGVTGFMLPVSQVRLRMTAAAAAVGITTIEFTLLASG